MSPYLAASAGVTIVAAHIWLHEGWWDLPLQVLPSMIGFSLGGYAIMLGFGDERFKEALVRAVSKKRVAIGTADPETQGNNSVYMISSAVFLWFILVQIGALIVAAIAKGLWFPASSVLPKAVTSSSVFDIGLAVVTGVGWFLGFLSFVYALTLGAAAALSVFRISRWFEIHVQEEAKRLVLCGYCRMQIDAQATVCGHCGRDRT